MSYISMLQPGVTMQSHNDLHSMIISRFRHPESHGVEVAMGGLAGVVEERIRGLGRSGGRWFGEVRG